MMDEQHKEGVEGFYERRIERMENNLSGLQEDVSNLDDVLRGNAEKRITGALEDLDDMKGFQTEVRTWLNRAKGVVAAVVFLGGTVLLNMISGLFG